MSDIIQSTGSFVAGIGIYMCDEGTREVYRQFGRSQAVRTMLCYWQDRIKLINACFALSGINNADQPVFSDTPSYPDAPNLLYLDEIECEGCFGANQGLNTGPNGVVGYPYARVKLTYSSRPWDQRSWVVTNMDFGYEEIGLPPDTYGFVGTATPSSKGSQRVLTGTIECTFYNQPIVSTTAWLGLVNCVNSAQMFGFAAAGTVVLYPPKTHSRVSISGVNNWDQTWTFHWRQIPWNYEYNPTTYAFAAVETKGGNPPYPSADLNSLFSTAPSGWGNAFAPPSLTLGFNPAIPPGITTGLPT